MLATPRITAPYDIFLPTPRSDDTFVNALRSKTEHALVVDASLERAAQKNSDALAELSKGALDPLPQGASAYLRFILQQEQRYDAVISAFALRFVRMSELRQHLHALAATLPKTARMTHLGIGIAEVPGPATERNTTKIATALFARRLIQVKSLRHATDRPIEICLDVLAGKDPRTLLLTAKGKTLRRAARKQRQPERRTSRYCATYANQGRGTHRLEVIVTTNVGEEVAAMIPVYVGVTPPTHPTAELFPEAANDPVLVERELHHLINRERAKFGVRPVQIWPSLVRLARQHSEDMRKKGYFGHRSPTSTTTADRLAALPRSFSKAAENLSVATGPAQAHHALMSSATHRDALLDADFSHVGIGVTMDAPGIFYITELFVSFRDD